MKISLNILINNEEKSRRKSTLFKLFGFRFLENRFRLANHGSKIHKILKITN